MAHKPKQVAATQTQPRVENSLLWEKQAPREEGHSLPTVPVFGACVLPEAARLAVICSCSLASVEGGRAPTKL